MPDNHDWMFDVLWDLSDRAQEAGLPSLAGKLEEAMDTYLTERLAGENGVVAFTSRRKEVSWPPGAVQSPVDARAKRRMAIAQLGKDIRVGRMRRPRAVQG
ncbi:MAG: hypothetical protein COB40_01490 [Marinosulfonomonas sp.]|nr:MAG: hypothetical protein COB40_01490 [Marinosulfonomonas sp.]